MSAQIIPLTTAPNQSFQVKLSIDGKTLTLQLTLSFNPMANYWVMNIADQAGNPLVSSVPLLTGVWPGANILSSYAYLLIGSAFMLNVSGVAQDHPDQTNLGSDFQLLWDDTPVTA